MQKDDGGFFEKVLGGAFILFVLFVGATMGMMFIESEPIVAINLVLASCWIGYYYLFYRVRK